MDNRDCDYHKNNFEVETDKEHGDFVKNPPQCPLCGRKVKVMGMKCDFGAHKMTYEEVSNHFKKRSHIDYKENIEMEARRKYNC